MDNAHQQAHTLAARLGVTFVDERLLVQALVHRSVLYEQPDAEAMHASNERLELLGDAVLHLLTAEWLYHTYPDADEGELTRMRVAFIKQDTLARLARAFGLGAAVLVSDNAARSGIRERDSLLSDAFEAVLGALYLDQGIDAARAFLHPLLAGETAQFAAARVAATDSRTRLQELTQAHYGTRPVYETVNATGPDHRRTFTVEVSVNGVVVGRGSGSGKQRAAQAAAAQALEQWTPEQGEHA